MTIPPTDELLPGAAPSVRAPDLRLGRQGRGGWCSVSGKILLPLQARHRGEQTSRYMAQIGRLMRLPPHEARRFTLGRLRWLLVHAKATSPFWRRRMEEVGFEPRRMADLGALEALPPLTRTDIAAHGFEMVSRAYRGRKLVLTSSGGTTSEPVPLAQLPAAVWWKAATAVVLRRMMGWHSGDRVALLWGAPRDMPTDAGPGWRGRKDRFIQRFAEHVLWLPADVLGDEILDRYIAALERFRPHVLQAYPSAADLLARRLMARGRTLEIPMVLLTAETVFPAQRQRISDALGAHVFSFYAAREVGWITQECPAEHRAHLNTPGIHLETADDGRILVTDLVDPVTPLIRYDIGDRGVLADAACSCGDPRPVLDAIQGRVSEVFRLPSGRSVPWGLVDPRSYRLERGVVESQLVQHAIGRCEIRWVAAPNFEPAHLEAFAAFLDEQFQGEMKLEWTRVERIEPEPNGKVRYCIPYRGD